MKRVGLGLLAALGVVSFTSQRLLAPDAPPSRLHEGVRAYRFAPWLLASPRPSVPSPRPPVQMAAAPPPPAHASSSSLTQGEASGSLSRSTDVSGGLSSFVSEPRPSRALRSWSGTKSNGDGPGPTSAPSQPCGGRRLLHWNILDGGTSNHRLLGIGKVVRSGAYEVVTMNEMNGMNKGSLQQIGVKWGLPHVALLAKSPYRLGILSRHALEEVVRDISAPFAHGLLCVRVLNVTLCLTHLNPHDVRRRQEEARSIVLRVPAAPLPFILVGDLNTLSPLDERNHERQALVRTINSGPYADALARKFLDRQMTHVDYSPMQTLLNKSLHDIGANGGETVPTSLNADKMHFTQLRLDYCLVNEALLNSCGGQHSIARAIVVRTQDVASLSDHYPLEITFRA